MRKMDVLGLALVSLSTRFSLTNSLHLLPLSIAGDSVLAKNGETAKSLAVNWGT
jgi:hypothetical protein